MKLVITNGCVGPKGEHLERGAVVEIESPEHRVALVGSGKALNPESEKGKEFVDGLKAEKLIGKAK